MKHVKTLLVLSISLLALICFCQAAGAKQIGSDGPKCIEYVDLGPEIVPQPGQVLNISIKFNREMDVNSIPICKLVAAEQKIVLNQGNWAEKGFRFNFKPATLDATQSKGIMTFSGARSVEKQLMQTQSKAICIGNGPIIKRVKSMARFAMENPHKAIFVNGYNYRTQLGLYEITGDKKHLNNVKKWAAQLLDSQKPQGYWGTGYGAVYFADTGSALGLLINYHKWATPKQQKRIIKALEKYITMLEKGDGKESFIHENGALGAGYHFAKDGKTFSDTFNGDYTISTSLSGSQIFAAMYYLTGEEKYKTIAIKATNWLLDSMADDGKLPYIIDSWNPGRKNKEYLWYRWTYDTSAYVSEGFIAAWTYIDDPAFRKPFEKRVKAHVNFLLWTQNDDGSWAKKGSHDQLRSHGLVNLLLWYYYNVDKEPAVARAIRNYYNLLLDEEKSQYLSIPAESIDIDYGKMRQSKADVNKNDIFLMGIPVSLSSRALVEIIKPSVDCYRWKDKK
ncbi:MAG: hypothetical protein KAS96_00700 [Planctomycetes bacterium]|nr:hypothetical protein [Planctomycetota bacterium]